MRGVRGWWWGWTVGCATQTGCVSVRKSPLQRHWESGDDSSRVSSSCLAGLETPVYTSSQNLVTQYQERYKIIKIWQIRFVSAVVQILYLWIIRLRSTLEIKYQTGTKWSKWKMWKLHSSWRGENKTNLQVAGPWLPKKCTDRGLIGKIESSPPQEMGHDSTASRQALTTLWALLMS